MATLYNTIANQSLERLGALSDGVFAFAMTFLLIDIKLPEVEHVRSEHDLLVALAAVAPRLLAAMLSFLALSIFWNGQQTQLNYLKQSSRDLTWLHLAFLFGIALLPLSTGLLAEFYLFRTALVAYWLNFLLLGALLYASWRYANHAGLIREDTPTAINHAICRRVLIAQCLYAVSTALCVFDTRLSLGCIFLVQLNYAVAPRWPGKQNKPA
ncbi:TMEM175 family protein [Acidipila sp. EB88]|uniref:TMEM175 family protein n=1 Tax=Acidipila sp. EB88 TaxID=2305226 RepID=UPI000F6030D0|nr:TMEM175 family protein [Acidipila sp. EB88]RRA47136.1 DUF1211 domain-containing protein [Acidipila sp. EB88]